MFELVRQLGTPNRKVGLPETTSMTSGGQSLAQNPALYSESKQVIGSCDGLSRVPQIQILKPYSQIPHNVTVLGASTFKEAIKISRAC